jgi:hypothetical protein
MLCNIGSSGIDGRRTQTLAEDFGKEKETLLHQLRTNTYQPGTIFRRRNSKGEW